MAQQNINMSRKIDITKYRGNTHYSVQVTDSYNTKHHLGYLDINLTMSDIYDKAEEIWSNEVKPKEDLMAKAIGEMIKLEKKSGLHFTDDRGNHRDGLD